MVGHFDLQKPGFSEKAGLLYRIYRKVTHHPNSAIVLQARSISRVQFLSCEVEFLISRLR